MAGSSTSRLNFNNKDYCGGTPYKTRSSSANSSLPAEINDRDPQIHPGETSTQTGNPLPRVERPVPSDRHENLRQKEAESKLDLSSNRSKTVLRPRQNHLTVNVNPYDDYSLTFSRKSLLLISACILFVAINWMVLTDIFWVSVCAVSLPLSKTSMCLSLREPVYLRSWVCAIPVVQPLLSNRLHCINNEAPVIEVGVSAVNSTGVIKDVLMLSRDWESIDLYCHNIAEQLSITSIKNKNELAITFRNAGIKMKDVHSDLSDHFWAYHDYLDGSSTRMLFIIGDFEAARRQSSLFGGRLGDPMVNPSRILVAYLNWVEREATKMRDENIRLQECINECIGDWSKLDAMRGEAVQVIEAEVRNLQHRRRQKNDNIFFGLKDLTTLDDIRKNHFQPVMKGLTQGRTWLDRIIKDSSSAQSILIFKEQVEGRPAFIPTKAQIKFLDKHQEMLRSKANELRNTYHAMLSQRISMPAWISYDAGPAPEHIAKVLLEDKPSK